LLIELVEHLHSDSQCLSLASNSGLLDFKAFPLFNSSLRKISDHKWAKDFIRNSSKKILKWSKGHMKKMFNIIYHSRDTNKMHEDTTSYHGVSICIHDPLFQR
jgi:hypothetical protein